MGWCQDQWQRLQNGNNPSNPTVTTFRSNRANVAESFNADPLHLPFDLICVRTLLKLIGEESETSRVNLLIVALPLAAAHDVATTLRSMNTDE